MGSNSKSTDKLQILAELAQEYLKLSRSERIKSIELTWIQVADMVVPSVKISFESFIQATNEQKS